MSGLLGTVVRLPFRLTQSCYFVFVQVPKNENSFGIGRVPENQGIGFFDRRREFIAGCGGLPLGWRKSSTFLQLMNGAKMLPKITLTDSPDDHALKTISQLITRFNEVASGRPNDFRPLAIFLSDPETGQTLGGLWGWTSFSFLHVDLLYVPESLRGTGIGRRMMHLAEEEAVQRGCHGVWLDTFSFQARGFYERLGYTVFGSIQNYPPGQSRLFLKKTLGAGAI
jgi:GNAT superfamily N-acetyltransferase